LRSSRLSDTPQNGKATIMKTQSKTIQKGKVVLGANIKKTSVTIDKEGRVISTMTSTTAADKIKQMQEARAKKLGFK